MTFANGNLLMGMKLGLGEVVGSFVIYIWAFGSSNNWHLGTG